jgi:ADP-ribose pyrophosphatase YjhB (NUDIX family)
MESSRLEKVTAFITQGANLLLFEHPTSGIQIPAGTVEAGETPEATVMREAREESGLSGLELRAYIGYQDEIWPAEVRFTVAATPVYAHPDPGSFDWARLRRGIAVRLERTGAEFSQVTYAEGDRYPDPEYITYQITGWAPNTAITAEVRRHFFHLVYAGETPAAWSVATDNHIFRPFWVRWAERPAIVAPQDRWLQYVQEALGYQF